MEENKENKNIDTQKEIQHLILSLINRFQDRSKLLTLLETNFRDALEEDELGNSNLSLKDQLRLYEIVNKSDTEIMSNLLSTYAKNKESTPGVNINLNNTSNEDSKKVKDANQALNFLETLKNIKESELPKE